MERNLQSKCGKISAIVLGILLILELVLICWAISYLYQSGQSLLVKEYPVLPVINEVKLVIDEVKSVVKIETAMAAEITEDNVGFIIDEIALLESEGKRLARGDYVNGEHLAFGTLQFHSPTFHSFGEKYGLIHTDIWDRGQQIAIARQMLLNGEGWHWSTFKTALKKWTEKQELAKK